MRKKEEKKRGHRGPDTKKEGRKRGELSEGKRERDIDGGRGAPTGEREQKRKGE